jgi:hypothetical protein
LFLKTKTCVDVEDWNADVVVASFVLLQPQQPPLVTMGGSGEEWLPNKNASAAGGR